MKNTHITRQLFFFRPLAGVLLAVAALPVGAVDLKTADGAWTFSLSGNVNVHYVFSSCQSVGSAATVDGGLTCVGTASGSEVSNIGNGLLPAAFAFGVSTTQDGYDLAAHLGLFPGIATNDGGSPNLQAGNANGSSNTALGSTGLDIRQVYMTFGNKEMGTFTLGRNIGLFGADVILNDMTLPGVGAPGAAASSAPANTTLGGIGFGYIYTDWLAQIDYTTPDIQGVSATFGVFDPVNSLSDGATVQPKKAPGFHAKVSDTFAAGSGKLYLSASVLTQEQDYATGGTSYNYRGTGLDLFAKFDAQDLELIGYYYHGDGLGTTALFNLGAANVGASLGQTRTSDGFFVQGTYKLGQLKVGVNYGESKLDLASGETNAALVAKNKKFTGGVYFSLTKNLTLLGEFSNVKSDAQGGGSNSANTVNVGAFLGF